MARRLQNVMPLYYATIELRHDPPMHIHKSLLLAQQSGSTDLIEQFTQRLDALYQAD